MKEALFLEQMIVKSSTDPVDLDAGANTGARIDMRKFKRVTFVIVAAAGTAPTNHVVSFQKHDAAVGGTSAALEIASPYFHKVGAATEFTKVELGAAASSIDIDALVADNKFIAVFEVLAEELGANSDHRWVSCNIADVGGAQLGAVIAIGHNATEKPAYSKAV